MATFGLPTASRQTGFETAFPGRCWGSESRAQSKKPRVVRGLRLPQGLLNRVEVFVLAGQKIPDRKPPKFSKGKQIKHLGFNASF